MDMVKRSDTKEHRELIKFYILLPQKIFTRNIDIVHETICCFWFDLLLYGLVYFIHYSKLLVPDFLPNVFAWRSATGFCRKVCQKVFDSVCLCVCLCLICVCRDSLMSLVQLVITAMDRLGNDFASNEFIS